MAKEVKSKENIKVVENEEQSIKLTPGFLVSKANYVIDIKCNGQMLFIQPFGKVKVIKEQLELNKDDAKYLSFVKI